MDVPEEESTSQEGYASLPSMQGAQHASEGRVEEEQQDNREEEEEEEEEKAELTSPKPLLPSASVRVPKREVEPSLPWSSMASTTATTTATTHYP